jgi:hypothetical protein
MSDTHLFYLDADKKWDLAYDHNQWMIRRNKGVRKAQNGAREAGLHPDAIWLFVDGITRRLDLIGGLEVPVRLRIGGNRLCDSVSIIRYLIASGIAPGFKSWLRFAVRPPLHRAHLCGLAAMPRLHSRAKPVLLQIVGLAQETDPVVPAASGGSRCNRFFRQLVSYEGISLFVSLISKL